MRRRRTPPQPRKTTRRWHIPPPLVHGPEALECGNILDEWSGPGGVVLWQSLRDVLLWSGTAPPDRGALFHPGAEQKRLAAILLAGFEEPVEAALRTLAGMVGDPAGVLPEAVGLACRQLSLWAEGRGAMETALAFAQDAALACPGEASTAYAVANLARARADHARAEVWFRRAIGLARQSRDWRMYSRAFRGLGNLYMLRGNYPAARRFQVRALRGARRGGMRAEQGTALHDLFIIEAECGRRVEAEQFAAEAFAAYAPSSPKLPMLAHDVGYWWMQEGHFGRALRVFEALLPVFAGPRERIFTLADLARASGGVGDLERFTSAWDQLVAELNDPRQEENRARVLIEMARGASSLGLWEQAGAVAQEALAVATERGEAKIRFTAEAILEAVQRRQHLAPTAAPEPDAGYAAAEKLASDLVETLNGLPVAVS